MADDDWVNKICDNALEMGQRAEYVEDIRRRLLACGPEALAICRRWDGPMFGVPGYGGADYFAAQIERAKKAVEALKDLGWPAPASPAPTPLNPTTP